MRKLATVRKIDAISPIPDADAIEVATVGGWKVVVKKGEFQVGDLAVYCEIDSWIPTELAPFLSKGQEPKEYNGVKGERLRTVKLRGQISQGLLLPYHVLSVEYEGNTGIGDWKVGDDVTEALSIQKYEAPIPAQLAGEVRGMFPSFIPKTDQERVQNLSRELQTWQGMSFEMTEKLDGASMTVYFNRGDYGVCSRNLDLKESDTNSLWKVAHKHNLITKLKELNLNIAIQGEIAGEGIQGNRYNIKGQEFFVFDVYDIDSGRYYTAEARRKLVQAFCIKHVPVIDQEYVLTASMEELLTMAEAKTVFDGDKEREGLVFKCTTSPDIHFKVISNKFLLKGGE